METEVLRIEGNVTVPKFQAPALKSIFESWLAYNEFQWSGNIVPQDSPTGMRLYRVEEVEKLRNENKSNEDQILLLKNIITENNKVTITLSEELAQEKESKKRMEKAIELLDVMYESRGETISNKNNVIKALQKRLELAENTHWRTFTKWWKELWK